jgi:uncharacterized protein YbcC (UPF0753/DUF2309 family)
VQHTDDRIASPPSSHERPRLDRLRNLITQAGNLLPISGPITAFAFLNTLQALEDLPFDQGLCKGARLFGCNPYLTEDRYREKSARGRIRPSDLKVVISQDLGERANEPVATLGSRLDIRLAMLQYPLRMGPAEELQWFVAETDALQRLREEAPQATRERFVDETRHWVMRDVRDSGGKESRVLKDRELLMQIIRRYGESSIERWSAATWEEFTLQVLWRVCREGVQHAEPPRTEPHPSLRHRDLLRDATGEDSDALVHELLIRYCASFTDQGLAHWRLPNRELGFFRAFCELYRQGGGPPNRWQRGLSEELGRIADSCIEPIASVLESLNLLGVSENEWDDYIAASLLALRGWAGMIWQMEVRSDRVPLPVTPGSLVEFLAIRLILERYALAYVAHEHLGFDGSLQQLRDVARDHIANRDKPTGPQRAFLIFQLAQVLGWSPVTLHDLSRKEWAALIAEVESFTSLERRRLFHQAFERRLYTQALDALSIYGKRDSSPVKAPRFQAVFCIDAREESFRRHIEEIAPDCETYSAAGFFGVAMYYRGAADAHFTALCPIVVRPQHWVVEDVVYSLEDSHMRRAKTRRALGTASHRVHLGSRSIAGGAILTAGLGVLASIPLVARVLFPRLTSQLRKAVGQLVEPPPVTRLRLERVTPKPGPEEDSIGFTVEEMANIGERMLREMAFASYSRMIIFFGHGSFCLNNPHKSAYDCGACTGSAGGPNARALAAILNDRRVREILATRGLNIPAETIFLGGLHNTAEDSLTFFDLDLLPKSHRADFESARKTLEEVCERNAHERCRRFQSAPLNLTFTQARRHVEERAEDLAQTRPEFGNASNAMCIVARRQRTRGLYLDRRSFLTSYDHFQDDANHTVLARILSAVVPVCEGINMTYFLSYVDSPGWGCGTKLPHNVTSLLGVMDGAASDLRAGLPWQSVEIHEPVRCLFIIESTPEAMLQIMERNETVGRILKNAWAQLAVLDPSSNEIQVFRNGTFHLYHPEAEELPTAASSTDWYRGWRDHLGFAVIDSTQPAVTIGQ